MRISTQHIKKRIILFSMLGALLVSQLAYVGFGSPAANAYSNQTISPIPANMTKMPTRTSTSLTPTTANPDGHMIRHVIKKENTSTMTKVQMAAYFSEARADGQHRIQIVNRDNVGNPDRNNNFERCHAYTIGGAKNNFIRVKLTVDTTSGTPGSAARTITYQIRSDRVCNATPTTNTRTNLSGASFFGSYDVPSGFVATTQTGRNCATQPNAANPARCDENTGLYRVFIEIDYNPSDAVAPEGEGGTYGGVAGARKQQATFRVQLINQQGSVTCGATATAACTRYLSIVEVDSAGSRNYSTLGEFKEYGNPWYTRQKFQFGLPCTQREWRKLVVSLYDIDNQGASGQNGSWGDSTRKVTFQIEKRVGLGAWTPVTFTTTGDPNNRSHAVVSPGTALSGSTFTPADGDSITSNIRFWMEPSANYRINVANVHARNLLGVGLPTETIFGDLDCEYNLQPIINAVPSTVAPGGTVNGVTGSVVNSTPITSYGNPESGVVRFVVPAGTDFDDVSSTSTLTGSGNDQAANAGCRLASGVVAASRDCRVFGAGARSYPQGPTAVWTGSDDLTGISLNGGDKVCYMTIVNLYKQISTPLDWRYSQIRCALVLTQPKVALWGNDLRVGSSFSGGTNLNASANAIVASDSASWVEYAITAPAAVTGLASQSGAVNGSPDPQSSWSRLTFANTGVSPGCPGGYGCFAGATALGKIPDVRTAVNTMSYGGSALNRNVGAASFAASGIAGIIGGADLGNFTRSASITTTGTITIDQDIVYDSGTLSGEGAIPQLILVGNNINITGNVRRIDAWLIATGTVSTCSDVANQAALRSNNCNNPLRINGPVMAGQLALNRTFADTSNANEAAETINLRGDAYIWASRAARQNGHWQTVYTTELPPRY